MATRVTAQHEWALEHVQQLLEAHPKAQERGSNTLILHSSCLYLQDSVSP